MRALLLPVVLTLPAAAADKPMLLPADRLPDAARLLDRFATELAATASATAMLERWCAAQGLARRPRVVAIVERGASVPPTPTQRALLGVSGDAAIGFRRVRLACGDHVLSEAENWFVPARLTAGMRAALAGDTPFGAAIAPLHPVRRTLASERLWQPPRGSRAPVIVPHALLRHRALVLDGAGAPLAIVAETYTSALLAGLSAR